MMQLVSQLEIEKPSIELVLFGKIANKIPETTLKTALSVEHPLNNSFVYNTHVHDFFKPFDLLSKHE